MQQTPRRPSGRVVRWTVRAGLVALALPAAAQDATPPKAITTALAPVEITGSSIRRLDGERALPVLTITRDDIAKSGAQTAAEILERLPVQAKGLGDGHSVSVGNLPQKGLNAVNLRGIGASSTLVLMNGRRMANFASPGDETAVDLNTIPMGAIERVEVLLDGASAIYGADAIAGVVNFITKRDYQGIELDASVSKSQEGGAGRRGFTIAAGSGSLDADGYNLLAVANLLSTDALRSSQRGFIRDLKIPQRLPHLLSGYTSPANIRLTSDQLDYFQSRGLQVGGRLVDQRMINFSAPGCNPPASLYLPNGVGGSQGCTYDYMRDTELDPASDKFGLFTRAEKQLDAGWRLFGEFSLAAARTRYIGSSARITGDLSVDRIPQLAALADGLTGEDRQIELRSRLLDAGNRASALTSTGNRLVTGLAGAVQGWDVEAAYTHAVSRVADSDGRGYLDYSMISDAVDAGIVNVLGPNDARGRAAIRAAQIDETVRWARGAMDMLDVHGSKAIGTLEGGDLSVAVGSEFRWERQNTRRSDRWMEDDILGESAPTGPQREAFHRKVAAVYGELVAPLTKAWELSFALRHDRYERIGGSTNPKLALRWTPSPEWLFRASAATGFRAPSLNDLYRATDSGSTATIPDPVCMAENDNDLAYCADNFDTYLYSNAKLKPERSRQFTLGGAWSPQKDFKLGADLWYIEKRDVIGVLGDDVILGNPDRFASLIHRYSDPNPSAAAREICGDPDPTDNSICYLELRKQNQGRQRSGGLDLRLEWRDVPTAWGRFGTRLYGTWMLLSKKQQAPGLPYDNNLGHYVTDGAVPRWQHAWSIDWEQGDWSTSLTNHWRSGFEDQNSAIDTESGTIVQKHRVRPYSLWSLSATYEWTKQLKLYAGIDNLFNTAPPYSNQAYDFLSGYDPSYTDPRGRYFTLSAHYVFR